MEKCEWLFLAGDGQQVARCVHIESLRATFFGVYVAFRKAFMVNNRYRCGGMVVTPSIGRGGVVDMNMRCSCVGDIDAAPVFGESDAVRVAGVTQTADCL